MKSYFTRVLSHAFLCFFVILMLLPVYLAFVAASNEGSVMMQSHIPIVPGNLLLKNFKAVMAEGLAVTGGEPITSMLLNSFFMAMAIALGKIIFALGSAFALVYFDFPFKKLCFALIFTTMMLPIEVRIVPTFQVVASFGLLNSYTGLTLPLFVSATGTFYFVSFLRPYLMNWLMQQNWMEQGLSVSFLIWFSLYPKPKLPHYLLFYLYMVGISISGRWWLRQKPKWLQW